MNSPCMFARKFDEQVDEEIIRRIGEAVVSWRRGGYGRIGESDRSRAKSGLKNG